MTPSREYHTHSTYFNFLTQEATSTEPTDPQHALVGYTPCREIPEGKLKESLRKVANTAIIKIILEESTKIKKSLDSSPSGNPNSNGSKPELLDRFWRQGLTFRETELCHQMLRYLRPELRDMETSTFVRLAHIKKPDCVQRILSCIETSIGPMEEQRRFDNYEDAFC